MDVMELARVAYSAHGKSSDYRTVNGDLMPKWDALTAEMKQWWVAVANAVLIAAATPLNVAKIAVEGILPFDDHDLVALDNFLDKWSRAPRP